MYCIVYIYSSIIIILGMLTSLDESVGRVIESLDNNGMLEDSIVLFISDNGAPADDPIWGFGNSGSNWPLRGVSRLLIF
jgi:arylsulfatase A-like enzyme